MGQKKGARMIHQSGQQWKPNPPRQEPALNHYRALADQIVNSCSKGLLPDA